MPEWRRQLRHGDAEAVTRLVARTGVFSAAEIEIAGSLVRETQARMHGADYRFVIADGRGGIDGYTCFGPIPGTERRYELYWIAVDPSGCRKGLGRALLAATEDDARALGGTHLFAETSTRPDYAAARAFYVANGFVLRAVIPDYHADGDGLAIFGKRLERRTRPADADNPEAPLAPDDEKARPDDDRRAQHDQRFGHFGEDRKAEHH